MREKVSIQDLKDADLALWAARAQGIEERMKIKLYASGPCLYRDTGSGGAPFAFRPDSDLGDTAILIQEMAAAGILTIFAHGAQFESNGFGHVGFTGSVPTALTRCYIAWKLGQDFTATPTN
ncbi:hypothetical protein PS718_00416 [Pseudomonas fluorescens]|uniref:DUF2591 domain-containing protein n=1 Tax=Pseudomonas fluorescens TaxID=294 RepID=A0A5E6ZWF7_PSEFL|nr:hypothetical protein [Pseudomonas fluorescens]VVN70832.1 hypothetical protein PS718_00416 [Pseudomonas fluorescens]